MVSNERLSLCTMVWKGVGVGAGAVAVAAVIQRDDVVAIANRGGEGPPKRSAVLKAVEEQEGWRRGVAPIEVVQVEAVGLDRS